MKLKNLIRTSILLALIGLQITLPIRVGYASPGAQAPTPEERAQALLDLLSPEERVGQLFLVTFQGTATDPESMIYNLIVNHHIGGVVLRRSNDNFTEPDNTPEATYNLIRDLQEDKWLASQPSTSEPGTQEIPNYVPLLIGISQEGDGYPQDQILSGLTKTPSPMALGATWQPDLAQSIGEITGQELSALGFNLLLGPSLDVLDVPNPESEGDLGTRTFGGDPYWVGLMGRAFVEGVHQGSAGKIALAGKHFPGHGGSDRPPDEEVATVRKSLEQLKQIELAPFFAVTGNAPTPAGTIDALLVSHINYQGFQGNIRATTRPVSFDEQALSQLMSLPTFATWRENGGVIISDDLGSRAVRRFYDPSGLSFNARLVARDAFLAGNDVLFLGQIVETGDADSYETTIRILNFFAQKYREDPAFAQRVDESALRVLTLKFRLFETFNLSKVLPQKENLAFLGQGEQQVFDVALKAATLISPSKADLPNFVPDAPALDDQIVFINDTYPYQQCTTCPAQDVLDVNAFQNTALRLYGPEAGGQITRRNLSSYTFADLETMLDSNGESHPLEGALRGADWVVFGMLDLDENRPASTALRRLLAERPDLIRQKRVIVFAFNAPYFLDATDISKLSAFYALYSKAPQFIEIAARILFKELAVPPGASPVSIQGIGYDLISATSPDPEQEIPILLDVDQPPPANGTGTVTPEPTLTPLFQIGELIPVRTGVIRDHNGNPVPDGTPVQFFFKSGDQTFTSQVETLDGVGRTSYLVATSGPMEIQARSDPATKSQVLYIDVPALEGTPLAETPSPTSTSEPTPTLRATLEAPPVEPTPQPPPSQNPLDVLDWILSFMISGMISLAAYRLGNVSGQVRWSIRWGLCTLLGGGIAYLLGTLAMDQGVEFVQASGRVGLLAITAIGSIAGWGAGAIWRSLDGMLNYKTNGNHG